MKSLLVAVDFSPVTAEVIRTATQVALAFGAHVRLVHIAAPNPDFVGYEAGPQTVRDVVAIRLRDDHRKLQDVEAQLRDAGVTVTALLVQGDTVGKILKEADDAGAGMILVGSHGHGALHDLIAGSVAEGVLRKASCPVLVVPSRRR